MSNTEPSDVSSTYHEGTTPVDVQLSSLRSVIAQAKDKLAVIEAKLTAADSDGGTDAAVPSLLKLELAHEQQRLEQKIRMIELRIGILEARGNKG